MTEHEFKKKFVVFILTHGRADNVKTFNTIRRAGYTGDIVLVVDDEDDNVNDYRLKFGYKNVYVFRKKYYVENCDNIQRGDTRVILYARNACFDIATEIGKEWFMELDDDYNEFSYKFNEHGEFKQQPIKDMDFVLRMLVEFLEKNVRVKTLAMAQCGDYVGGKNGDMGKSIKIKRKAMNSFICNVDRRFKFIGRVNEDVNTYVLEGTRGGYFSPRHNSH